MDQEKRRMMLSQETVEALRMTGRYSTTLVQVHPYARDARR